MRSAQQTRQGGRAAQLQTQAQHPPFSCGTLAVMADARGGLSMFQEHWGAAEPAVQLWRGWADVRMQRAADIIQNDGGQGGATTIEFERSEPNARVRAMRTSATTGVSWIRALT